MKALVVLLFIGPANGPVEYIDTFTSMPACQIAGTIETPQNKASWVHCVSLTDSPLPPHLLPLKKEGSDRRSR